MVVTTLFHRVAVPLDEWHEKLECRWELTGNTNISIDHKM